MTFGFTSPARRSGAYFAKKRAKRDLIDAAVREAMKRMQYEDDLQSLANREPPPPEPEPVVAKVDAPMTVNVSVQPQPARHDAAILRALSAFSVGKRPSFLRR